MGILCVAAAAAAAAFDGGRSPFPKMYYLK